MNIVGSTAVGSPNVSPKLGGSFTGLATGMVISPCVVFPAGATIVDLQISAGESFEASVNAAEESYLYTFKVQETTVSSFSFAITHSLIAKVVDPDAATNTALFSFSGVSSVAAVVGSIGGAAVEFGFVATDALTGSALMSRIRRLELGFTSVHLLACVAALKSKRTEFLSLDRTHDLTCSATLKVRRVEPLSFSVTHMLTPKAKVTVTPVTYLTFGIATGYIPTIVWKWSYTSVYGGYTSDRFEAWAYEDDSIFPVYNRPIDRTNIPRSKISPRAVLTIT